MSERNENIDPITLHHEHSGKIGITSSVEVNTEQDLSVVYARGI
ncbi:Uncharacterised protein [Staphylococcus nepalensis]|nr:Uncharacterised protein [Staphylococcus nepalensis]SUM94376.1 Uncharacterised protein [Staphylococcus nepalensis]